MNIHNFPRFQTMFFPKTNYSRIDEVRNIPLSNSKMLQTTPVFNTYWKFASERQALFLRRVFSTPPPWTNNPVLASHRFTNVYRAADRVSQYMIRNVLYEGPQTPTEIFFRTLLFKFFNRIETWEKLATNIGRPSWTSFNFEKYSLILDNMLKCGERIYSAAYIMPSPAFGNARKHRNHLQLLEYMIRDGAPLRITKAKSLKEVFEILRSYPSIGDFLAFQFAIDLNYSEIIDFSEMDFVVAGPGARDGISKCFENYQAFSDADIIRIVAERADDEFNRLGLPFDNLWGRPLQLIDCQNLFCEVSKYSRIVHPEVKGKSGRTRIKQKYAPSNIPIPQWYPPKWGLNIPQYTNTEMNRVMKKPVESKCVQYSLLDK